MPRRLRATLRGKWWTQQYQQIRRCYSCGGKLVRQYVPAEQMRRHVCSKCSKITYVNPKVVAGLIPVMPDGRIVLLRRNIEPALGRWSYAAGFQEMAETVQEAAAREAFEEATINVTVGELVGIYSYADAGVVTIVYEGRVRRGENPAVGIEAKEVRVFDVKEIPWHDLAFRSTTEALKDWIKQKRRAKKK